MKQMKRLSPHKTNSHESNNFGNLYFSRTTYAQFL